MFQHILFDLDGTLTDPKEGITKSVEYALNSFGVQVENLNHLSCFIGPPLIDSFIKYYNFNESDARLAVEKYRERFTVTGIFENKIYEGIPELLKSLKDSGKNIYLATSKPYVFAKEILEHFDIIKYFDYICGSELDGTRTDKAEVISHVLGENSITDLDKTVMAGDRKFDIIGAKTAKISSVGVLFGYGSEEELISAGADKIVLTVDELKNHLFP